MVRTESARLVFYKPQRMSKNSSQASGSQDFLVQLQQAEKDLETREAKARKKAVSDLQAYEKKAENKKQDTLEAARTKAKDKVKARQVAARARYEERVSEGAKEVRRMEQEIEPKIEKQVPVVQSVFVNEILG